MKQVSQRLRDGRIDILDVPLPTISPELVLVDVRASLLSAGTERTKVVTARKGLVAKARSRPDDVRQVLEKARRDGVRETLEAVRLRLDQPTPLGYSSAGVVLTAGARVSDLAVGDRVACSGAGFAVHAEAAAVPGNLCARVPAGVSFDEAAFTTMGCIALHGVRQADVRVGEKVAVIGLGLVGQLAAQILRAAGCTVVGIDVDPDMVELAESLAAARGFRADEVAAAVPAAAAGCDAVIIAAATSGSGPLETASQLCRDRGRIVVVGDVGMSMTRSPYYEKELELRMSRSYGPGRYDREYEERGLDYPIGYVRWTERRNMEAFLQLLADRRLDVEPLIAQRLPIDEAPSAYARLIEGRQSPLGLILHYEPTAAGTPTPAPAAVRTGAATGLGLIGVGSFAQRILVPAFRDAGFELRCVASSTGLSARGAADRFGFARSAQPDEVLDDPAVDLVAVATRHGTHAEYARRALENGKDVFVEKPPAIHAADLAELAQAERASGRLLMVGFNRRHAPLARALREHFSRRRDPLELVYRVSAGPLAADHWLNDPQDGGGRLIGEGCHFVDFACWAVGALPSAVTALASAPPGLPTVSAQSFTIGLRFDDGSIATILYTAGGAASIRKEYAELHAGGRSGLLDDFRTLTLVDGRRSRRVSDRRRDKGHRGQLLELRRLLAGETETEPGPSQLATMAVTFAALESALSGRAVDTSSLLQGDLGA